MNLRKFTHVAFTLFVGAAGCTVQSAEPTDALQAGLPAAAAAAAGVHAAAADVDIGPLAASLRSAHASLATLRGMTSGRTEAQLGNLGFKSYAEVQAALPAEGIRMAMVGLAPLANYRASGDPRALLQAFGHVLHALTVGGEVRSAVVIAPRDGELKPIAFGKMHLAQAVMAMRGRLGPSATAVTLVEMPAISVRVLAHEDGGRLMVTPLDRVAGTTLEAGQTVPASDAFAELATVAQRMPDDMRD